jgi:hypothetical protein
MDEPIPNEKYEGLIQQMNEALTNKEHEKAGVTLKNLEGAINYDSWYYGQSRDDITTVTANRCHELTNIIIENKEDIKLGKGHVDHILYKVSSKMLEEYYKLIALCSEYIHGMPRHYIKGRLPELSDKLEANTDSITEKERKEIAIYGLKLVYKTKKILRQLDNVFPENQQFRVSLSGFGSYDFGSSYSIPRIESRLCEDQERFVEYLKNKNDA